jgi:spermidine synthase
MLRWEIIERAPAAHGSELVLARRGDEWAVRADGQVLMTSRLHGSEEALAALAIKRLPEPPKAVMVGGLGMGFTLRAVLNRVPAETRVVVVELSKALVGWNRGPLAELADKPLEDPRTRVQVGDVLTCIREATKAWNSIILDVDNGPSALSSPGNSRLYGPGGLAACHTALRAGGTLAVWSAGPDERFLGRMVTAGFDAEAIPVPARRGGGARHFVFVGIKRAAARQGARNVPQADEGRGSRRR